MREIADELGVTKAALYHHFAEQGRASPASSSAATSPRSTTSSPGPPASPVPTLDEVLSAWVALVRTQGLAVIRFIHANQRVVRELGLQPPKGPGLRIDPLVEAIAGPDAGAETRMRVRMALFAVNTAALAAEGLDTDEDEAFRIAVRVAREIVRGPTLRPAIVSNTRSDRTSEPNGRMRREPPRATACGCSDVAMRPSWLPGSRVGGAAADARCGHPAARRARRRAGRGRPGRVRRRGRRADRHARAARPRVRRAHRAPAGPGPGALPRRRRPARGARTAAADGPAGRQPHQGARPDGHRRAPASPGRAVQHGRRRLRLDVRVATTATLAGEKCVLRLLDSSAARESPARPQRLADLGMQPEPSRPGGRRRCSRPFGMVLCSGPTGSGKTTTLYATIDDARRPRRNIMTIEDPVEYVVDTVNQIQINHGIGVTFASGLKSIMRQDPDVILVGEIRDVETARIAVQSALTGHLVLSTVHATDSVSSLYRFLEMGIELFLVTSSIMAVMAQRLAPPDLSDVSSGMSNPHRKSTICTPRGRAAEDAFRRRRRVRRLRRAPATTAASASTNCCASPPASAPCSSPAPARTRSALSPSPRACGPSPRTPSASSPRTSRPSPRSCARSLRVVRSARGRSRRAPPPCRSAAPPAARTELPPARPAALRRLRRSPARASLQAGFST